MRFASGFVMVALGACGAERARVREPVAPLYADPLAAPIRVELPDAKAYNERIALAPNAHGALGDAVRARLQELAGSGGEIRGDSRLDATCNDLAALVSREAGPSAHLVELMLYGRGVVEPAEHVVVAWDARSAEQAVAAVRAELGALEGYLRVGVGTAEGGPLIAIAVRSTGVVLAPTPRAVAPAAGFDVVATLDPRLDDPVVVIRRDSVRDQPPVAYDEGGAFGARFECSEIGTQWLEILANGPGGQLPRIRVPIQCAAGALRDRAGGQRRWVGDGSRDGAPVGVDRQPAARRGTAPAVAQRCAARGVGAQGIAAGTRRACGRQQRGAGSGAE